MKKYRLLILLLIATLHFVACEDDNTDPFDFDCPDLEANIGELCRAQDSNGVWFDGRVTINCECV
jgi:hypothetical protein